MCIIPGEISGVIIDHIICLYRRKTENECWEEGSEDVDSTRNEELCNLFNMFLTSDMTITSAVQLLTALMQHDQILSIPKYKPMYLNGLII